MNKWKKRKAVLSGGGRMWAGRGTNTSHSVSGKRKQRVSGRTRCEPQLSDPARLWTSSRSGLSAPGPAAAQSARGDRAPRSSPGGDPLGHPVDVQAGGSPRLNIPGQPATPGCPSAGRGLGGLGALRALLIRQRIAQHCKCPQMASLPVAIKLVLNKT